MCIVFVGLEAHPIWRVVIAANRDETFERSSEPIHLWNSALTNQAEIYAGRDNARGGTWLSVNSRGGFCALTNFEEPNEDASAASRGEIPKNFAISHARTTTIDPVQPAAQVVQSCATPLFNQRHIYNGVNVICGDFRDPASFLYFSNRLANQNTHTRMHTTPSNPTISVLTNAFLDTPWPKSERGRDIFGRILQQSATAHSESREDVLELREQLFAQLLSDPLRVEQTDDLPKTNCSLPLRKLCSSICVEGKRYGTRAMTVCVASEKQLFVWERVRHPEVGSITEQGDDWLFEQMPQGHAKTDAWEEREIVLPLA